MCGRFALFSDMITIVNYCDFLSEGISWTPHYNIPPGIDVPLLLKKQEDRTISFVRWGFTPYFTSKSKVIPFNIINAKSETITQKNIFKHAFKYRRCLIPANGFYEWRNKDKQPFFVTVKDQPLFFFAGIWSRGNDKIRPPLKATFAIITTRANNLLEQIHHRMPVIIGKHQANSYLADNDEHGLQDMLNPYNSEVMDMNPVSKEVNNAKNNHPGLIKPIG